VAGNSGDLVSIGIDEILGYVAGGFGIYAFRAKTMIPLRIAATCGCAFGLAYGALRGAQTTTVVNAIMLALNFWRLLEMRRLIRDSDTMTQIDPSRPNGYDWLKPFMHRIELPAGHVLFRKGEVGAEAFLIGSGEVHIPEYDATVRPGDLLGEIGLLATDNLRSATAVCRTPVRAWRASYHELKELCLQNPQFCLHLATLIVRRYEHNLRHARREIETPAAQSA
jgi:CRP/FNR family transcriptional regulator, cyclic AMP receptor protein